MKKKRMTLLLVVVLLCTVGTIIFTLLPRNTAGEVIGVELSDIDHILVSTEVFYLDDWNNALWATVTHPDKVEAVYHAISRQKLAGHSENESLSGACPRFVTYVLKDGNEVTLRFMEDQQLWLDSNTAFELKTPFQLYDRIDEILKDYIYQTKSEESTTSDPVNQSPLNKLSINSRNTSLSIFSDLSGKEVTVTDEKIIEPIVKNLNELEFEPYTKQEEAPGYSYNITFYNNLTPDTTKIMILDQAGTIFYFDGNCYTTKNGFHIDVTYLADLIENKE